jgi:hypothetical protein
MKSRRLTIFCVAMIALAGTPRVWREVGKLLTVVQHKAQVKFWSMVLPGERGSAGAQMIAAVQPLDASLVDSDSTCPLQSGESWENQASGRSKSNRLVAPASVQFQARVLRETDSSAPASHAGLIARALKAPRGDGGTESLLRSRTVWEHQPTAIAGNLPSPLAMPSAATLPHQPAGKGDTFIFVMPPPAPDAASSLAEKEAVNQFKLIKKAVEAGKLLRQKGRFPVSGIAAFPSS